MSKIKIKTKRAVAKRFHKTAKGNLKRKHGYRSHLAHNKSHKQKLHLKKDTLLNKTYRKNLNKTLQN